MMDRQGKLLIAPPVLKGNYWSKSVIFITEDHDQGSIGIILNKRSKMSFAEFGRQCKLNLNIDGYVYIGGPVSARSMTLLHSSEWACDNTMKVTDDFSISSSVDALHQLSVGNRPEYWKLFVGLCAWRPHQLESEIKGEEPYSHNHSWLLATPNYDLVFNTNDQDQWANSIELSGSEFVQNCLA